jgi:hypothetical protein
LNLTEHDDETRGLLGMLSRALSRPGDNFKSEIAPAHEQKSPSEPDVDAMGPPLEFLGSVVQKEPAEPALQFAAPPLPVKRRTLSTDKVQSLILENLRQIPDFPERGVAVTVYGFRPWNAMLNFAPGSTSHREAIAFREALADIVRELRTRVEIDTDQGD